MTAALDCFFDVLDGVGAAEDLLTMSGGLGGGSRECPLDTEDKLIVV
jgi:hypothetical protein